MGKLKNIKDGFANIIKGLGTPKDPRMSTVYQKGMIIDQNTASNLYTYNWLASKVVDIPIDDATRKWRTLLIDDPDKKEEIETSLDEFDVKEKYNLAAKWARVYGGSAIVIIIDGDNPEDPLLIDRIQQGKLKNLIVLDRYNIYPDIPNRNILSTNFGQPEYYTVSRDGQRIHHSRIIKFMGDVTTIMELEQRNFWGNSIYTFMYEPISDSQITSQSISNLVFESNVDVYKIEGFNALIAEGDDDLAVKRLKLAHEMKGIINGIALDKEDDYEKKSNTFAQLPEIDDRFIQKVAGASGIPVTRLLGISPSGMNATGESDMLNYYDLVQSLQENYFRPKLNIIDSVITANLYGEVFEFEYKFKALRQLSEKEQAEVDFTNAQRDQIYLDQDVINTDDVQAQLAENGTYVAITPQRVEEERELQELEFGEEETEENSTS